MDIELPKLDGKYLSNVMLEVGAFLTEVKGRLESARLAISKVQVADGASYRIWVEKHEEFDEKLKTGIERLVREMRKSSQTPDVALRDAFRAVLERLPRPQRDRPTNSPHSRRVGGSA